MANDEFGEKTEQPTERRRSEAREKGNVARSSDLNSASLMFAVAAALLLFGTPLTGSLAQLMRGYLNGPAWTGIDRAFVLYEYQHIGEDLASAVVPLLLLLMAAGVLSSVLQFGFVLAPDVLQPRLARLSPLQGVRRILSVRGLVKLAVSLGKLLVVVAIAAWTIAALLPEFLSMVGAEPSVLIYRVKDSLVVLAFELAAALLVLALVDFAFQKWKYEQDLKMTKQEVRDEMKNMEGDPHLRQRRREAHRKLAQARELQRVKDADVVVTNPTEIAVAVKYDPARMPAPTVVAKGMGEIAARIRQLAIQHHVPIVERKQLARILYRNVPVGQPIPVELYEVFVEIMAYVYRLTGRTPPDLD